MKRRKRSHMTEADCLEALRRFSCRVARFCETSLSIFPPQEFCPRDRITVGFEVAGSFGVGDEIFEAIRVLAGYKLPAKDEK